MSEIDEVIRTIKQEFPNVVISQLTNFGEKPFESGVWKFWLKEHEAFHFFIEVHD